MSGNDAAFDDDDFELDPDMLEAIARAEAAVADMAGDYGLQLAADIALLDEMASEIEAGALQGHAVRKAFDIAHNLKGQGGSFGYHLVSDVGQSLCEMLRERDAIRPEEVPVVRAHVAALLLVSERDLTGDGGEEGQAIRASLRSARARVAGA